MEKVGKAINRELKGLVEDIYDQNMLFACMKLLNI